MFPLSTAEKARMRVQLSRNCRAARSFLGWARNWAHDYAAKVLTSFGGLRKEGVLGRIALARSA